MKIKMRQTKKFFCHEQATTEPTPNIVLLDINQNSTRQGNRYELITGE